MPSTCCCRSRPWACEAGRRPPVLRSPWWSCGRWSGGCSERRSVALSSATSACNSRRVQPRTRTRDIRWRLNPCRFADTSRRSRRQDSVPWPVGTSRRVPHVAGVSSPARARISWWRSSGTVTSTVLVVAMAVVCAFSAGARAILIRRSLQSERAPPPAWQRRHPKGLLGQCARLSRDLNRHTPNTPRSLRDLHAWRTGIRETGQSDLFPLRSAG